MKTHTHTQKKTKTITTQRNKSASTTYILSATVFKICIRTFNMKCKKFQDLVLKFSLIRRILFRQFCLFFSVDKRLIPTLRFYVFKRMEFVHDCRLCCSRTKSIPTPWNVISSLHDSMENIKGAKKSEKCEGGR